MHVPNLQELLVTLATSVSLYIMASYYRWFLVLYVSYVFSTPLSHKISSKTRGDFPWWISFGQKKEIGFQVLYNSVLIFTKTVSLVLQFEPYFKLVCGVAKSLSGWRQYMNFERCKQRASHNFAVGHSHLLLQFQSSSMSKE